ncbi:MAG TPA: DUF4190 domain-containing protein [Phycisphaerae bacterium]|nr:DUF4190 domain-containing protein [Phycisphaerae bacterium]
MAGPPVPSPIEPLPYAGPPAMQPGAGKATASLILGIISVVFWLCPPVGLVLSVTGLVLGIMAQREYRRRSAKAGIILCVIGLLCTLVNGGYGAYMGATGKHALVNRLLPQTTQPVSTSVAP